MPRTSLALAVLVATTLAASRASAYRTTADDPEIGQTAGWGSGPFELAVGGDAPVSEEDVRAAFHATRETLARAACPPPTLQLLGTTTTTAMPGDGRNTLEVVTDGWSARGLPPGQGGSTELRVAFDPGGAPVVVEADIYLNADEFEIETEPTSGGALWLSRIVEHEVLHALGLLHPCESRGLGGAPQCEALESVYRASALYPYYLSEYDLLLSSDDESGLCAVYPSPQPCAEGCPEGSVCEAGACVEETCVGVGCSCETQCGTACTSDVSCGHGACAIAGELDGLCVPSGAFGSSCSTGNDCASLLCVSSTTHSSYCTVECSDDAQCPGMQACRRVQGRDVCASLPPAARCSAGVRSGSPSDGLVVAIASCVAAARLACGWRRKRCS